MLNLKRKLLSALLICAILGSLGSTAVWSEDVAEPIADEALLADTGSEETSETPDEVEEAEEEPAVTEESTLAEMEVVAETDGYKLYLNSSTAVFAFEDKANEKIWWSTPYDVDSDEIAKAPQKKMMKSSFSWNSGDPAVHRNTKVTSFEGSVSKKTFTVDKIENGVKLTYTFDKQGVTIPVQFKINQADGCLDAEILVDEIVETNNTAEGGSMVIDMSLLPGFGSAGLSQDGYIIVPDGSGAVINYNNGKTSTTVYESEVYGRDYSIGQLLAPPKLEQVYLPCFGMVNKNDGEADSALLAVVAKGDEFASICANVSGQATTSYNSAYFKFTLRASDTFYMGSDNRELSVYESLGMKTGNILVKYYSIKGDELGYVDVAEKYRDYLFNNEGLTAKATENDNPFYLSLYGGAVNLESILGFPVSMQVAATTFEQARLILEELKAKGVGKIVVLYSDFSNSGIESQVSWGMDYSGLLGGKAGWQKLEEYCAANDVTLVPAMEFTEYFSSGNGYSFTLNACKMITKAYATQPQYERAFGTPVGFLPSSTLLSPYYFIDIFDKMIKSLTEEGIKTVSLEQATNYLYSDFSRINVDGSDYYTRADMAQILCDGLKKLNDAGISVIANEANAYLLPYVDSITNVPLYSSNFDVFDYDIPFYEMVIHGTIPYTTKPVNASANKDDLLLLSLATGTPLNYTMMYNDPNDFADSNYADLFYSGYAGWLDNLGLQNELFQNVIPGLSNQKIVSYKYLSATEIESVFENGTTIFVDLDNFVLKVNGQQIDIAQYGVKGVGNVG